jgi:hypothetical protein
MFAAFRSMARPRDSGARDFGPGPEPEAQGISRLAEASAANDNHGPAQSYSSALPLEAVAIIEPVPISVNQSGRVPMGAWRLRFAERWASRPDLLTGWTGRGDPLAQIELRFENAEAAKDYCRRAGIRFELHGSAQPQRPIRPRAVGEAPPQLCCWPSGPHALCRGAHPCGGSRGAAARSSCKLNNGPPADGLTSGLQGR